MMLEKQLIENWVDVVLADESMRKSEINDDECFLFAPNSEKINDNSIFVDLFLESMDLESIDLESIDLEMSHKDIQQENLDCLCLIR